MSRLNSLLANDYPALGAASPVPEALPLRIDAPGAREAVLLLHGFSGYPGEMLPLARGLASAGYAVRAPRYPGHGTCRGDFLQVKAEDWVRCAFDAYADLKAEYDVVHVAGHSMGGLLASAVAVSFDAPRLILLAPAFELSIRGMRYTRLLAPFKKVIASGRAPSDFDLGDPARRKLHGDYWADVMVGPAAELERLRRLCRRNLGRLRSRVLVLVGDADRTVPVSVSEYIRGAAPRAVSFEARTLQGAEHIFVFNDRAGEAVSMILDWMAR